MFSNCGDGEDSLSVPWTARRSNQSILKEINPEYSLEGLMLKLQYFHHLMWRANTLKKAWCWERLRAEGEGGNRGWDGWMASLAQWTMNLNKLWKIAKDREAWCAAVHRVAKSRTWLSKWTTVGTAMCLPFLPFSNGSAYWIYSVPVNMVGKQITSLFHKCLSQ